MSKLKYSYGKVRKAIHLLSAYLADEWITDGCEDDSMFGCASCHAIRLRAELQALLHAVDEIEADR
jgi:hypothetical protein